MTLLAHILSKPVLQPLVSHPGLTSIPTERLRVFADFLEFLRDRGRDTPSRATWQPGPRCVRATRRPR